MMALCRYVAGGSRGRKAWAGASLREWKRKSCKVTFVDLSETGELVLDTPTGRRLISAGEIFFARKN